MKKFDRDALPDADDYYEDKIERLKVGPKRGVGLCPFHGDRTPSWTYNRETGYFKCFACGEAGSIVDFHMKRNGLGFVDACKELGAWK